MKKIIGFILAITLLLQFSSITMAENVGSNTFSSLAENSLIPVFSVNSGFYKNSFQLELSCANGLEIFYTTDGSQPQNSDTAIQYTNSITIDERKNDENVLSAIAPSSFTTYQLDAPSKEDVAKATVICASCKDADGNYSDSVTKTYFVGESVNEYNNCSVFSMTIDSNALFDYDNGIYTKGKYYDEWKKQNPDVEENWMTQANYTQKGKDWEKECNIEFFDTNKKSVLSQECGVRIQGGTSRCFVQKSLRFYAREEYGKKKFSYPFFDDTDIDGKVISKCKAFTLRNGGNDSTFTKYSDALLQKLGENLNVTTQKSRPCILFIDGEFWGVYVMQEDYREQFIESKYGVNSDNVVLLENGIPESELSTDTDLYNYLSWFIITNDMTLEDNYKQACNLIDVDNFIDYFAFQMYINNADCYWNNTSMWRVRDVGEGKYNDGRWRMMIYDTEFSSGLYDSQDTKYDLNNIKNFCSTPKGSNHIQIFANLMNNESFKEKFVNRLLGIVATDFNINRIELLANEFSSQYSSALRLTEKRFGIGSIWAEQQRIESLKNFFKNRLVYVIDYLRDELSLGNSYMLTIKSTSENGCVTVNGEKAQFSELKDNCVSSLFYENYPVSITAEPDKGYNFVGWSGDENTTQSTISLSIDGEKTISAVFKKTLIGDCNDDGIVNIKDVLYFKKYLANNVESIDFINSNVDYDDCLSSKDVLKLKKFLARYYDSI